MMKMSLEKPLGTIEIVKFQGSIFSEIYSLRIRVTSFHNFLQEQTFYFQITELEILMQPNTTKQKTRVCESAGFQADADTALPKDCSQTCKNKGASPSNTAPCKYQQGKNRHVYPLRCALDSLYLSFHGTIYEKIESRLSELKEAAQSKHQIPSAKAFIAILDHQFEVKAKGMGKFAYVLEDNWFQIQLSSRKSHKLPLAYVQIRSELLTFQPLKVILKKLKKIIKFLGEDNDIPRISRLDLCLDSASSELFDFEQVDTEAWRTKASFTYSYFINKKRSGFSIGKGDVVARIYNKSLEIKSSGKDYLKEVWLKNEWNGQSDVWRVEFQFRRDFLQQAGIAFIDSFLKNRQNLWHYATTEWLNLTIPNQKDSNASRWPVHPAWLEISNACTCDTPQLIKRVTKERLPSNQYLFVSGLGALTSFMARESITDLGEAFGEFWHQAFEYHSKEKGQDLNQYLTAKIEEKVKRFNKVTKDANHD